MVIDVMSLIVDNVQEITSVHNVTPVIDLLMEDVKKLMIQHHVTLLIV